MSMILKLLAGAIACAVVSTDAQAQAWPSKPITIVAPFATSGASDILARMYAKYITEETGGTVLVDNKPGANGMIGASIAAKAAPDGYTVLMGSGTVNASNYALYADRITYKPADFATVAVLITSAPVIFAAPGIKGDTVQAAVASAVASPKGANCGTGSTVTLVACEILKRQTKANIVSVSYKGNSQSLTDLAGGQITLAISDMGAALPLVSSGRIRPVAVAGQSRMASLPGVPTAKEQGLDMDILSWSAVFVPAGTPEAVIQKLNAAARRMMASPEWQKFREATGSAEVSGELAYSRKFVQDEIVKWARYVRETDIKGE